MHLILSSNPGNFVSLNLSQFHIIPATLNLLLLFRINSSLLKLLNTGILFSRSSLLPCTYAFFILPHTYVNLPNRGPHRLLLYTNPFFFFLIEKETVVHIFLQITMAKNVKATNGGL